jgi:ubiquinone/menaquinone biosynthesis C-methylase UbiE
MISKKIQPYLLLALLPLLVLLGSLPSHGNDEKPKRALRKIHDLDKAIVDMEDPSRETSHQPEKVMDLLRISPGQHVADIGAGTGYFSFRLATRVGSQGRVFAVEIEERLLDYLRQKMKRQSVENLILVKSSTDSPNLPTGSCDRILVVDTYNYFSDPVGFMGNVSKALKQGGVVAIINRYEFRAATGSKNKRQSRLALVSEVVEEMGKAGLELKESHDVLKERYFLVFQQKRPEALQVP